MSATLEQVEITLSEIADAAEACITRGAWWRVLLTDGTTIIGPILELRSGGFSLYDMTRGRVLAVERRLLATLVEADSVTVERVLRIARSLEFSVRYARRQRASKRQSGRIAKRDLRDAVRRLHWIEGLSFSEIAEITGVPVSTAHRYAHQKSASAAAAAKHAQERGEQKA